MSKTNRDEVIAAYRLLLGRAPESEEVIESHLRTAGDTLDLVRNISRSPEFAHRVGTDESASPFQHFNAAVDVRSIVQSHVDPRRQPRKDHIVNFLGVAMPIEAMPHMAASEGKLDPIPIPANYHADMAEWAGALRAVELAKGDFAMIELGCGWACWMTNTGVAARRRGLRVDLIGIEGDEKHIALARRTMAENGIRSENYTLIRGVAAAAAGFALFPSKQEEERWGAEPIFGLSEDESARMASDGKYERLRMVPLAEAMGDRPRIDLLHMDIQGGEAALVEQTVDLLSARVAYLVIGTHSRAIEGRLMEILQDAAWRLEIERPAIFDIVEGRPVTRVDGVQAWLNPKLLRD